MRYGRWEIAGYDRAAAASIMRAGINPLAAVLLNSRGCVTRDDAERYITCKDVKIHDPFLLKDMDRAAERVKRAIENGEKIAVYGDYDVDGITSSCLLTDYLRWKGACCTLHIPERLEDGYGVRENALLAMKNAGIDLVVTVDCGMTAISEIEYALSIGLDIVVTDHHECGEILPPVPAVNPKRSDCGYPEKTLAGVGVAFKLVCAIEGAEHTDELIERYGDLVAIGTVADVMSVMGENRILIRRGLEIARRGKRHGIAELCRASGIEPAMMTIGTMGFVIAPRLNAAGRIGSADMAAELVMADNREDAERIATELCLLNRRRQELEGEMFLEATESIGEEPAEGPIVIASEKWHQGIAGIVASRLAEKYRRPAVVICLKDGMGRGSCRSFGGFDLFSAVESAGEYLQNFGGHKAAAGITVAEENIEYFKKRLTEYYIEFCRMEDLTEYNVDFEVIKPGLLTIENVESLKMLEPYGNGNPAPLLCILGAETICVISLSGGKHMKFKIKKNGESFECVCFGKSPEDIGVEAGDIVDVAFQPQINDYKGRKSVQLLLTDIYIHKNK